MIKIVLLSITLFAITIVLLFGYRDIPIEDLKAKYGQGASSFISVDGMDVHFRDEGDENDTIPVVLIHGTGSSLHTFDQWTHELKDEYRVVRMDLPGYGLTGPFPSRDYSVHAYVQFIEHFLEAMGISKCVIGGNSLGGHISWRFTVKNPQMVNKLILIDATGYPFKAKSEPLAFSVAKVPVIKNLFTFITPRFIARSSVENIYADKSKVTAELASRYFELTLRPGNRQAFVDRFTAKYDEEAYKQISEISHPTLILWGDKDLLVPVENAARFHQDLPNDTLVILEGTGHVPMEESPARSVEAAISFLRRSGSP